MRWLSKFNQFNCLLNGTTDLLTPRADDFNNMLLFTVLSPIVFIIWFSIIIYFARCIRGASHTITKLWWNMVIVTFWLTHPDICHYVFASFACINVDDSGKSRLFYDLEVVCWEGNHQWMINVLCIPSIIVFIIGMPAFFAWKLKQAKAQEVSAGMYDFI